MEEQAGGAEVPAAAAAVEAQPPRVQPHAGLQAAGTREAQSPQDQPLARGPNHPVGLLGVRVGLPASGKGPDARGTQVQAYGSATGRILCRLQTLSPAAWLPLGTQA